jgi:protein involved in polysaccharide export with SLBB domain
MAALVWLACAGCASITNPVANGLPVNRLPDELRSASREGLQSIPLTALRQPPPAEYRLGPGDVLGIFIPGVLGAVGTEPPVRFERTDLPPALGFPVTARGDGTLALPLSNPIQVRDKTLAELEAEIRRVYLEKQLLKEGRERIIVTLMRPRQSHILVLRQDSPTSINQIVTGPTASFGGSEILGVSRHGTGHAIDLPAYENDVLNALAKTGGLPGTDAVNEVVIERGMRGNRDDVAVFREIQGRPGCTTHPTALPGGGSIIRIPLRVRPGEPLSISLEDVILQNGDVVFIEAREAELFYTGGLLPPGEHVLPRDFDLDVVQAVMRVRGPLVNGGFATSSLSGAITQPGIGNPSPSLLTVLRKTPGGGQVNIRVDLNRALEDPRERILVQAGDTLILQETPEEAVTRYLTQRFTFTAFWRAFQSNRTLGTATLVSTP